jgi:hypothetical protein
MAWKIIDAVAWDYFKHHPKAFSSYSSLLYGLYPNPQTLTFYEVGGNERRTNGF